MRELVTRIQTEQRGLWEKGQGLPVEHYLDHYPELRGDRETVVDLIYCELLLREEKGEKPPTDSFLERFPDLADPLQRQFRLHACLRDGLLVFPADTPYALETLAERTVAVRHPAPETAGARMDSPEPRRTSAREYPSIPGYDILGKLGAGGRGVVYKARQLSLNRDVALKMIRHDEDLDRPEGLELFRREAEAIGRLEHPNIVRVYDFGEHAGRPYFAMELVAGGSLERRLKEGPLNPLAAAELVETLARALDAVHQRGIMHRDLKPANVLLTAAGVPMVADFGLVKRLEGGESLFPSNAIVGTASYMAPEQAMGNGKVGPAADVYALGAILYECLTGRPPFRGASWYLTLDMVRSLSPVPPGQLRPGLPRDLETICLKCLRKNPARRYASAAELADRLRLFLEGKPVPDRPQPWPARVWRTVRSHPLSGAAAMLLAILAVAFLPGSQPPKPKRDGDDVQARLEKGLRYEFRGKEQLPGPFRWVVGDAAAPQSNPADACFAVQTWDTSLLQLVADPGCERFRFSVEVRHDSGAGISLAGLYFGYREHHTPGGRRQSLFFTLSYAERGTVTRTYRDRKGNPLSRAGLDCWLCETRKEGPFTPLLPLGAEKRFRSVVDAGGRGPWRKVAVEVTPQGVQAFWGPGKRQPLWKKPLRAAWLEQQARHFKQFNPAFADVPTDFRPRAGLGLYTHKGKVSFRRLVLEPLPQKPLKRLEKGAN